MLSFSVILFCNLDLSSAAHPVVYGRYYQPLKQKPKKTCICRNIFELLKAHLRSVVGKKIETLMNLL